jgi:uncharacterized membrane protein
VTTIVIVLVLLLLPTVIGGLIERRSGREGAARLGAVIGLSGAFAYFASGHFAMADALAEMLPPWVPDRHTLVVVTGLLELGIAIGLLLPRLRPIAGWAAASVLVLFLPANIYAALNAVGPGGHQWGPAYLLVRAPLQLLLVVWTFWFVLRETIPPERNQHTGSRSRQGSQCLENTFRPPEGGQP